MYIRRNETGEFRSLWELTRIASEEVAKWPAWKRGRLECEPSTVEQTELNSAPADDNAEGQPGGDGSLNV